MEIQFLDAKNGELTATVNDFYLHSSYNPSKEAERFVSSLTFNSYPDYIIVIEPCLSYAIKPLKKRFPKSKLIIIRLSPFFENYNSTADFVINFYEKKEYFESLLTSIIPEEDILSTLIVQWEPSSKVFKEISNNLINRLKEILEKTKTILITREYFEKKWLINSINTIKYLKHPIKLECSINKPIIIISSGPSLKDAIPVIKQYRNNFFIIVLSSALSVSIKNEIIPDLCISTDGGYWAGQHLKKLYKFNIPLALPIESFLQKQLLNKLKIIPLNYGDGISSALINWLNIPNMQGERNGSVSGTALQFALQNSTSTILFAGLDMSCQKGYQHSEPNELQYNNSLNDNKLNSKEKRMSIAEFNSSSLEIYKKWFEQLTLSNRKVYRIINNKYKKNQLGQIIDIDINEFKNFANTNQTSKSKNYFKNENFNLDQNKLFDYISHQSKTEKWYNQLYPLSITSLKHNENNSDIKERILKENNRLLKKIEHIINE